jgi:hypothetical protein
MIFFFLAIVAFILYGAVRIILGWILPRSMTARIDAMTWSLFYLSGKLLIVMLAVAIVAAIYAAS